mgnify:CR=1 FL=1
MYWGNSRIILLGVLYAGPQATATGEIIMTPNIQRPIAVSHIPNNLGLVIKSERILELEKLFKAIKNIYNKSLMSAVAYASFIVDGI